MGDFKNNEGLGSVVKRITALPEDLGSIPIPHVRCLTMACTASSCYSIHTFLWSLQVLPQMGTHSHRYTQSYKKKCLEEGAFGCCSWRFQAVVRLHLPSGPVAEQFKMMGALMKEAILCGLAAENQGNAGRETQSQNIVKECPKRPSFSHQTPPKSVTLGAGNKAIKAQALRGHLSLKCCI